LIGLVFGGVISPFLPQLPLLFVLTLPTWIGFPCLIHGAPTPSLEVTLV